MPDLNSSSVLVPPLRGQSYIIIHQVYCVSTWASSYQIYVWLPIPPTAMVSDYDNSKSQLVGI